MLEVEALTERQHNSVEQIMKGGRHLLELVNDLLEISRIESGELSVSLGPVDIAQAVHDIVLLVEPLAAERSVTISHQCRSRDADRARGRAAREAGAAQPDLERDQVQPRGRPGRRRRVSCRRRAGWRCGSPTPATGIAAEDLERLFSPFERLGAEQTAVEGTGLGLALSKLMVEAMNGSLEVSSVPGEGSTFTVELPAPAPRAATDRRGKALAAVPVDEVR